MAQTIAGQAEARMRDGDWLRLGCLAAVTAALLVSSGPLAASRSASAQPFVAASGASFRAPLPSGADLERLRAAFSAAEADDWSVLLSVRGALSDPVARRLAQWRYASATRAPLSFPELRAALRDLPGWPGRGTMRARAEEAIFSSALSPRERIEFLSEEGGPATGNGRIALALAQRQTGARNDALELARRAWREDALSEAARTAALAEFGASFSADDHAARVDLALWRGARSEAQALLSRLTPAQRALANARIMLQTRPRRGVQQAVDAVPASLADDPGLLYDRARYVRRAGRPEEALPIAARIAAARAPLAAREDIAAERRLYITRALRNRDYQQAYNLAIGHGLSSGEAFADSEWLAGWVSLRFRNNPARAAQHFATLNANVSTPVSRSRALYWMAEAARAQNRREEAQSLLTNAAQYNYTYYGLLAASRLGDARLNFNNDPVVPDGARQRFEQRELVRALRILAEIGDRQDFESIAYFLDDTLDDPLELELLSQFARERGFTRTALRTAKAGIRRGVLAPNAAFPLLDLPPEARLPGRAEPALTHAIIRQESEFDPSVVSPAGARGLMQLMPATARMQANREGMSYAGPGILTADPAYNVTLGSAHLGMLVDDFRGSYVLAIAAYNAGSHRANEWVAEFGDPRSPSVDVVDWIELIPFSETRNYVQRVLENLQVYRQRLAAREVPITIEQDMRRGR